MPIAISLMMTFSIMLEVIGTPTETTVTVGNDTMVGSLVRTVTKKLVTDLPAQLGGRMSDFIIAFVMYWYQYLIEWNVTDEKKRVDDFAEALNEESYQQDTKLQTLRARVEIIETRLAESEQMNIEQTHEHQNEMAELQKEIYQLQGTIRRLNTQLGDAAAREANLDSLVEEKNRALDEKEDAHRGVVSNLENRVAQSDAQRDAATERANALSSDLDELHTDYHRLSTLAGRFSQWRQAAILGKVQRLEKNTGALEQRALQM
ncbi:MAG: hypothetical protein DHS20C10_08250 [marine bacterium B5-7]|nr:MAG: hypothetical protein DHS20C10_08250 [marine bacterium B5-7]